MAFHVDGEGAESPHIRATGISKANGAASRPAGEDGARRDVIIAPLADGGDKPTLGYRVGRSDRIAIASLALMLGVVAFKVTYPDKANELAVDLRTLMGLFAGCFLLGISGWFASDERRFSKLNAIATIAILIVLNLAWETLASGGLSRTITQAVAAIGGITLR